MRSAADDRIRPGTSTDRFSGYRVWVSSPSLHFTRGDWTLAKAGGIALARHARASDPEIEGTIERGESRVLTIALRAHALSKLGGYSSHGCRGGLLRLWPGTTRCTGFASVVCRGASPPYPWNWALLLLVGTLLLFCIWTVERCCCS